MARPIAIEKPFDEWFPDALAAARSVLAEHGVITADDLHGMCDEPDNPNWWGALFKSSEFQRLAVWGGECKNSSRPSRSGSMIRVWRSRTPITQ